MDSFEKQMIIVTLYKLKEDRLFVDKFDTYSFNNSKLFLYGVIAEILNDSELGKLILKELSTRAREGIKFNLFGSCLKEWKPNEKLLTETPFEEYLDVLISKLEGDELIKSLEKVKKGAYDFILNLMYAPVLELYKRKDKYGIIYGERVPDENTGIDDDLVEGGIDFKIEASNKIIMDLIEKIKTFVSERKGFFNLSYDEHFNLDYKKRIESVRINSSGSFVGGVEYVHTRGGRHDTAEIQALLKFGPDSDINEQEYTSLKEIIEKFDNGL